jgi:hypothetical protein
VTVGPISNGATPSILMATLRHASLYFILRLSGGRVALFPIVAFSARLWECVPCLFRQGGQLAMKRRVMRIVFS